MTTQTSLFDLRGINNHPPELRDVLQAEEAAAIDYQCRYLTERQLRAMKLRLAHTVRLLPRIEARRMFAEAIGMALDVGAP